jgi:nicotinamide riboside kinase
MVRATKLALVGAGGIGKTTLLEACRQHFGERTGAAFVSEAARTFFTNNLVLDRFSAETQGRIQMLAFENERNAHLSGAQLIICDRSVVDAVVYVRAQGDAEGADFLMERMRFWLPTYDKFLLLDPKNVPFRNDAVRAEREVDRQLFHEVFAKFLDESKLPHELLSGALETRLRRLDQIVLETISDRHNSVWSADEQ